MGFRSDFLWGGATAANQYEGGWNEGGRGPANTDVMTKGSKDQARGATYTLPDGSRHLTKGVAVKDLRKEPDLRFWTDTNIPAMMPWISIITIKRISHCLRNLDSRHIGCPFPGQGFFRPEWKKNLMKKD